MLDKTQISQNRVCSFLCPRLAQTYFQKLLFYASLPDSLNCSSQKGSSPQTPVLYLASICAFAHFISLPQNVLLATLVTNRIQASSLSSIITTPPHVTLFLYSQQNYLLRISYRLCCHKTFRLYTQSDLLLLIPVFSDGL